MPKRKFNARRSIGSVSVDIRAQKKRNKSQDNQLYTLDDSILVLGDGDFSFSRGLIKHRGGGKRLYATSYDSEQEVRSKYSNAKECIDFIRSAQAKVLHDVDATNLKKIPTYLKDNTIVPQFFQYIIFNFPHSGQQRVHINRALLRDFFESARDRLVRNGEVHITLKTKPPYSNWSVEEQAKSEGFVLKERRKFNLHLFPGYKHCTTDPLAKKFEPDLCITYVFIVDRSKYPFVDIPVPLPRLNITTEQKTKKLAQKSKSKMSKDNELDGLTMVPNVKKKKKSTRKQLLWTPLHRRSLRWATDCNLC